MTAGIISLGEQARVAQWMRASAYGAEGRRFESCLGHVSNRKHPTQTPEASASQLLSELREMNRTTRETMADLKALLKEFREERQTVESLIVDIRDGQIAAYIEKCVEGGMVVVRETVEVASRRIEERLENLASSIMGIPLDVLHDAIQEAVKHEAIVEEIQVMVRSTK